MTYIPDDPAVAALIALCKRTKGGHKVVADTIEANDQSLYQIISGVKLPSGNRKGVGPELRKKLSEHYPGWMALAGKPVIGVHRGGFLLRKWRLLQFVAKINSEKLELTRVFTSNTLE